MGIIAILLSACFFSGALSAQRLEFFNGFVVNQNYDFQKNEGHYRASYRPGYGFASGLGLAFRDIFREGNTPLISLRFQQFGGSFRTTGAGLGGGYSIEARTRTQILALSVFPLNVQLFNKRLEAGLGAEASVVLTDHLTGTRDYWQVGPISGTSILNKTKGDFSKTFNAGAAGRLAWVQPLERGWELVPQLAFYWGLTERFFEYAENTKNICVVLGVGLRKRAAPDP